MEPGHRTLYPLLLEYIPYDRQKNLAPEDEYSYAYSVPEKRQMSDARSAASSLHQTRPAEGLKRHFPKRTSLHRVYGADHSPPKYQQVATHLAANAIAALAMVQSFVS